MRETISFCFLLFLKFLRYITTSLEPFKITHSVKQQSERNMVPYPKTPHRQNNNFKHGIPDLLFAVSGSCSPVNGWWGWQEGGAKTITN